MSRKRLAFTWALLMLAATLVASRFPIWRMPWIVRRFYFSEKMHIVMHLVLFIVLAILIASALWRRGELRGLSALANWRLLAFLASILLVAVAQEVVQLRARGLAVFRVYEVFDLGVDLAGALGGLVVFHTGRHLRTRALASKRRRDVRA